MSWLFSSRLGAFRKVAALASFVAFAIALSIPLANASEFPYAWPPTFAGGDGTGPFLGYGFAVVDSYASYGMPSQIQRGANRAPTCAGLSDPACTGDTYSPQSAIDGETYKYNDTNWIINRVLPPCQSLIDNEDCIEGLTINDPVLGSRDLKLQEIIPGNTWPVDPSHGLGAGSATSLWTDPLSQDPYAGFAVTVLGNADGNFGATSFPIHSFQASVVAYQVVTGSNYVGVKVVPNTGGGLTILSGAGTGCAWAAPGRCGVQTDFLNVGSISLTLHVPKTLTGWLFGRLRSPDLRVTSLNQNENRVSVSGEPIHVPLVSTFVSAEQATKALTDILPCSSVWISGCHGMIGTFMESTNTRNDLFALRDAFLPWIKDQAQIMMPAWSFGSSMDGFAKCSSSNHGLIGVVTTNATGYQGGPPSFDGTRLNYKVWAVHRTPLNDVFKGSYDLVIRSDFARCLYNFSNAPVQAKVEITTDGGQEDVATTTLNEKAGWIHLSANNFTFSSPTVHVRLMQEVPVAKPSVTPSPTATRKPLGKKVTIICTKGKVTKKVTGLSSKCPSGYKKK